MEASFSLCILVVSLVVSVIDSSLQPVPLIDVDKDVRIDLYTLKNPDKPQIIKTGNIESITASNYNPKVPTRIFIHGFRTGNGLRNSLLDAYLIKSQYNINLIEINWEKASITINYPAAKKNVGIIGQYTANFIDFMVKNEMLKLSELIVIGFSLGAHAAGFTGKTLRSGKLEKIYGLDPAGVGFNYDKPEKRLNKTDAKYVETIQTSKLGFVEPIGNVSFYPNGGHVQPTCEWDSTGSCSHSTAYLYFAQSIIYMDYPLLGDLCSTIDDVRQEKCDSNKQAAMGGEPGAMNQPNGMYYIRLVPDPDELKYRQLHGGLFDDE